MKFTLRAVFGFLIALSALPASSKDVDVDAFIKKDHFKDIKLSPNGDYLAATVPREDRTVLVVMRRADNKITANVTGGKDTVVGGFWWVNPQRVLVSLAEKMGALDAPRSTGELYAVNAEGGQSEILIGHRADIVVRADSLVKRTENQQVSAELVDDLPGDDKNVVISVRPLSDKDEYTDAERMDVYSGRRTLLARAPVREADFMTDNRGAVRFAFSGDTDQVHKLFYRADDKSEWRQLSDATVGGHEGRVLGFSEDDKTAYLVVAQDRGPDTVVAFDVASESAKVVLRDDVADPARILYRAGGHVPVGAFFLDAKPRTRFFDEKGAEARRYHGLEAAMKGEAVSITSQTKDGKLALVRTWSDRNPGDYFLYDATAKQATHLVSQRDWLDPDLMAEMRPVTLNTRDGFVLHGFVTLPKGADGKHLPMVVMPHGGPFDVADVWDFEDDSQMLASAGYAVLQVNFRGSRGFGKAFLDAGKRQWGGAMQDDLTDATRWAITQGIADAKRICIGGASYGAYAALMGVAKEPGLYQCAFGYVGVYDLQRMYSTGDIRRRESGKAYLNEWVGGVDTLADISPTRLAGRIKVPVFLTAGGQDERAPIVHTRTMEAALKKAGVPVETLYFDTEGHGYYTEAHQRELYTNILRFLAKSLGGNLAASTQVAEKK